MHHSNLPIPDDRSSIGADAANVPSQKYHRHRLLAARCSPCLWKPPAQQYRMVEACRLTPTDTGCHSLYCALYYCLLPSSSIPRFQEPRQRQARHPSHAEGGPPSWIRHWDSGFPSLGKSVTSLQTLRATLHPREMPMSPQSHHFTLPRVLCRAR